MATTDALYCREEKKVITSIAGLPSSTAVGVKATLYMVRQGRICHIRVTTEGTNGAVAIGAGTNIFFQNVIPSWMKPDPLVSGPPGTFTAVGSGFINTAAAPSVIYHAMLDVQATGGHLLVWTLAAAVPAAIALPAAAPLEIADIGLANPSTVVLSSLTATYIGADLDI